MLFRYLQPRDRLKLPPPFLFPALSGGKWGQRNALRSYYLLQAKKGTKPLDPVARFHLANGARLERLNWGADISASGVTNSFGLMVNYVYGLSELERNHETYAQQARVVASRDIEKLSAQAVLSDKRRNGD